MATTDVRKTILDIMNVVLVRLGVNEVDTVTSTTQAKMLLALLNDVIDEMSNYGDWQQMYREVDVTAISSVGSYEIVASAQVKNIYEIHWNNDIAPLEVRDTQDIRRLQRVGSFGTPRQFAVVGVSGVNPLIRVYPTPTTSATFDVAFYKKPRLYTSADGAVIPSFPAKPLEKGLYAKAVLEENGGEPNPQYEIAYKEYVRAVKESISRFTSDTGTDMFITPSGKRFN